MSAFDPELRTMAFVPRWAILWKDKADDLAQHSYFVTVYTRIIINLINWKGPADYAMWLALTHDADETISGDVIGPVKDSLLDTEKANEFLAEMQEQRMPGVMAVTDSYDVSDAMHDEAFRIVHCADKLDALLWLIVQFRTGNLVVRPLVDRTIPKIEGAWRALPASEDVLSRAWQTQVLPSINAHFTEGGRGV